MKLRKQLSLLDVFAIAAGAMISSGLFVLPGLAYAQAGPAMIVSYLLAGLLILPSMFAKAELATAMPKAGGTYFYIERSMGASIGTFGGIANWVSMSLKSAFALVGIGAFAVFLSPHLTEMQVRLISVAACLVFTLLNLVSVRETGRLQVYLVLGLIGILVVYIGWGFVLTHPDRYTPFMPVGWGGIFSTAGMVFVSYVGLTKVASIAEEVKNPGRNIPLGMSIAVFVVTLLYVLAIGVTVGIVDAEALSGSLMPLSLGASRLCGRTGAVVLAVCAMIAFITTANAGILSASRSPMAMSRDRLIPHLFSRVNRRYGTPHVSLFFTSGFMVLMILFLDIEDLVKTASTLNILLFVMVNVALIVMRESKIQNYRPKFIAPLYPWLYFLSILFNGFLLVEMGRIPLLITSGFVVFGGLIYALYARTRVLRKSAMMHVVERITAKELHGPTLGKELKEIVIERDEISEDRFDQLVKRCAILDLPKPLPVEEVFSRISSILAVRLGVEERMLYEDFMERERQSCTVVRPGLAIPHVIVPGEKKFDIMLVRCRKGLSFSCVTEPVHALFVLTGSMDERNYHLRALMAIAHIAHEGDFEAKWLAARNKEELRDVVLLSSRRRDSV
ncbi:MAG: amino acid permease [bacterium]